MRSLKFQRYLPRLRFITLFYFYIATNAGATFYLAAHMDAQEDALRNRTILSVTEQDSAASRIQEARALFIRPPRLVEPKMWFIVLEEKSINAFALIKYSYDRYGNLYVWDYKIYFTEIVVYEIPLQELAFIYAHELAHVEGACSNEANHWDCDIRAAKIVGKAPTLAGLNRLRNNYRESTVFLRRWWLWPLFPYPLIAEYQTDRDLQYRIKQVNTLP